MPPYQSALPGVGSSSPVARGAGRGRCVRRSISSATRFLSHPASESSVPDSAASNATRAVRLERLERKARRDRRQAKAHRAAMRRARREVKALLASQPETLVSFPALARTLPFSPDLWRVCPRLRRDRARARAGGRVITIGQATASATASPVLTMPPGPCAVLLSNPGTASAGRTRQPGARSRSPIPAERTSHYAVSCGASTAVR